MSKNALKGRIERALQADPSIVADIKDVETISGHPEAYLKQLGLTRYDLKQLWNNGLALRGNLNGETRWILIASAGEATNGGQSKSE